MNFLKYIGLPILSLAGLLACQSSATAQNNPSTGYPPQTTDTTKAKSTTQQPTAFRSTSTIKSYKEVIPANAKSMKSFITVHLVADRYLFEIPDSMMKRDILIVSRIDKNPVGEVIPLVNIGYAGDEAGKAVIAFEKIPGDKIALRSIVFKQFSNDTTQNGLGKALLGSNYQTILGTFPIKAVNKTSASTIIDLTDFINGDNNVVSFGHPFTRAALGTLITDRSYIDNIMAFPANIEIKAVKTYNMKPTSILSGTPPPVSYEFNNSMILLPKVLMKPRLADPRIGFFSNEYVDFDANPRGVTSAKYIQKWRLEPKAEDMQKYLRGELVEPKKPIVIYIDPATPKKWIPYLIAGINDWQVAFEKAGFKQAIIGKEAPVGDFTWSLNDARHSVLVYKPSTTANASGPNINDPRTGEILETHINWYHSVMSLVQSWYKIQAGAIDPGTHQPDLDDDLMGKLIRFVSSHEIGHTIGLMHNFGSSSTVPVANLRNKAWVEEHGHTPSIMDYARFNYVAQPEDHITEKGIFPRIGDYDKWAVEWGYKLLPNSKTAEDEKPILNKWLVDKLASDKQYFYGSQLSPITNEFGANLDPRDQSEDLGDDAMLASTYGIKNLKRIEPHLIEWSKKPDENYDRSADLYKELVLEYSRFMGHVLKNIGGIYETPKTVEQPGPEYVIVEKAKQKRAMAFLQEQLFKTPYWLIDEKLYSVTQTGSANVTQVQKRVLAQLLNVQLISLMISEESDYPGKAYTVSEMLNDLYNGIFSELASNRQITVYRRDLQKTYIEAVIKLLDRKNSNVENDEFSIVRSHARLILTKIRTAKAKAQNHLIRDHFIDLAERLDLALHPKQ